MEQDLEQMSNSTDTLSSDALLMDALQDEETSQGEEEEGESLSKPDTINERIDIGEEELGENDEESGGDPGDQGMDSVAIKEENASTEDDLESQQTIPSTPTIDRHSETFEQALARITPKEVVTLTTTANQRSSPEKSTPSPTKKASQTARSKLKSTGGLVAEDASAEEEELIKRKRAVIVTFNGIFRFSKSLALNCIPCDRDLPESSLASLDKDINGHTTSLEHLQAWSLFVKREQEGINKLLSSAIQDGVFVAVCDGFVRCLVCNNVISDSLAFLKRHLFNEKHRFKGAPLPMEAVNTYANPYGQAARKLTCLVARNPALSFATDKGNMVVSCAKCAKIMPRGYSEVSRHLRSKMHANALRKKPGAGEEAGLEEVITLSDDEAAAGGGGGTVGVVANSSSLEVDNHRGLMTTIQRKPTKPTSIAHASITRSRSSSSAVAAAAKSAISSSSSSKNSLIKAVDREPSQAVPVARKTRAGGVSKAKTTTSSSSSSTPSVVPPKRTFGGRGRPSKMAVQQQQLQQQQQQQLQDQLHQVQLQHQQPQTLPIEMTAEDGTITEGQIILMEATEPHSGELDPTQAHLQLHTDGQGELQPSQHFHFIEVIHEEQVEFVDDDGNAHTATIANTTDWEATLS